MPTLPQLNTANRITKLDTSSPDERLSTPRELSLHLVRRNSGLQNTAEKRMLPREELMLSDPIRIADAIDNPRFHPGDEVVLSEGPHKYVHGTFLRLKEDVEWAAIKEANGAISSHPVEWMSTYTGPLSYSSAEGRKKE
jgi:hypothetical protein